MKKKIVLMSLMIVALICAFAISVFATEFTVTTADEFDNAYSQAQDGDTIVIKSDISAQFNFGKSITYILDGGVRWSAKGGYGTNMCDAPGKTVKVYARNGDGAFYPASGMWFNNTGTNTTNDLSSTTFSLGSLDNSKLTLDCSAFTASNSRMFYDATLKEFNLLSGVVVTNLNVISSGSRYINASTVNMYDGAEICGNKMTNYTAIIYSDVFNMYGGKIYGNYLGCYGVVQSGKSIVFGGEVCNNYVTGVANSGVPSALFNSKAGSTNGYFEIYGGSINNNLLLTTNAERQSILCAAGDSHITVGVYFDNYETTDWGEEPIKVGNVYASSYDVANASASAIQGYYTTAEYSVVFKSSDGSIINAYMLNNGGNIVKAYDGSTEVTVPESQSGWTTKPNYCLTVTPSVDKQGTYYIAIPHSVVDDHNCETALDCQVCAQTFEEAKEHILNKEWEWEYKNGYLNNGYCSSACTNENCTYKAAFETPALFTCLGYSHTTGAIMQGFAIDKETLDEYVALTNKDVKYGILAASGNVTNIYLGGFNDKVINVDFTNRSYDIMEMKIYGITSIAKDTQLYCCGYVIVDGDIIYMDEKMADGAELPATVSYAGLGGTFAQAASLDAVVPTKEEVLA
ncbi:MAG: hypothetical protein IJ398_08220 [Clostridia bacterium]|nr:hypothetical protein [Clostridia bacterium]